MSRNYPIEDVEDGGIRNRQQRRRPPSRYPPGEWPSADAGIPYPAFNTRFDRLTGYTFFDRDIVGFFYLLFSWIYTIAMIPIRLFVVLFRLFSLLLRMFYPFLVYVAIIWILWYLVVIYWPYVIDLVLAVVIPILNILILLFNFFAQLFIFLYDLLATIWNAVVPFIGIIIQTVINVILTVLSEIFNAIGAFDWEPIISAFMQILNILVEIAVQILIVLIKVGAEILTQVAQIITPLVNFLLEVIKAIMPVIQWIFELLYDILEPILGILGALFGSGGGSDSTSKGSSTGRRLFSVEVHPAVFTKTYVEHLTFSSTAATYSSLLKNLPKNISSHEAEEFERIIREIAKEPDIDIEHINDWFRESRAIQTKSDSYTGGRRLFANEEEVVWKQKKTNGLRFVDDLTTKHSKHTEKEEGEEDDGHLHDVTDTIARHMLASSNTLRKDTISRARETMSAIRAEVRSRSKLSIYTILQEEDRKMRARMPKFHETLASVEYPSSIKHPKHMVATFHDDLEQRKREQFGTGRKTLGVNWNDVESEQLDHVKVKHMREIIQQTKQYTDFHQTNIKIVNVAYSAFTRSMKYNMETVITPEIILKHWGSFLRSFGYKTLEEVHTDYVKNYGNDPWEFMTQMSAFTEHPILRAFKKADPANVESPYWHDWALEQKKYKEEQRLMMGRRLLQMQSNGDDDVRGDGESHEAISSFPVISTLDCFSSPKNPFCLPLIPLSFKPRIPQIKLTPQQIKTIRQETTECKNWHFTNCLICWDRIRNAVTEILFILSAIPFINYPIAQLTVTVPWTNVFLEWIFVVPKFKSASLFSYVCFIYHLYDLFVTLVILFVLAEIVPELWDIVYTTLMRTSATFAYRHKNSYLGKIRARAVERVMEEIRIGASLDHESSSSSSSSSAKTMNLSVTNNYTQVNNQTMMLSDTEHRHLNIRRRINGVPREHHQRYIESRLQLLHDGHVDLSQGHDPTHVQHLHKTNKDHPVNRNSAF